MLLRSCLCAILLLNAWTASAEKTNFNCNSSPNILSEDQSLYDSLYFYPVYGKTIGQIKAFLETNGPRDADGIKREGLFKWNISWQFIEKNKKPKFSTERILELPCWMDYEKGDPQLKKEWDRYTEAMIKHELIHATNFNKASLDLQEKFDKYPYSENTEINFKEFAYSLFSEIRKKDIEYDLATDNGKSEGIVLKIP